MDEDLLKLFNDLQNNGYDLFNIKDPFYNDICTPYKSVNDTDVILYDRKNDFYNNNYTTCQSNCHYSAFDSKYKLLKCECKVIVDDFDVNDFHKFSQKIFKNFYNVLENSNYKVMKCYKLVFNWKYLRKNIGNFIVLTLFAFYLGFFIIYLIQGIKPLQQKIKKNIYNNLKNQTKQTNFPPKKKPTLLENNSTIIRKKKKKKNKRKSGKLYNKKEKNNKSEKTYNNKDLLRSKAKLNSLEETKSKSKLNIKNILKEENKIKNKNNNNKLDDLDLNNLEYAKAIEQDKRTLFKVYWSRLKNKHLIIYTFVACNDYNLIYIKISRFIFLITTNMALNVLFFFDVSMHKIYLDYGKYSFIQQIPQIIYSSLVSLIIEMLIGFLSYTDKNIYQIRQLKEIGKIDKVLKIIKIKLIIFFIITFLFFALYWYLISCFCAVYNNTQIIYIKDFVSSFSMGYYILF